jgi:DNA-directed RNA polymerase specialized sigma24 family protein
VFLEDLRDREQSHVTLEAASAAIAPPRAAHDAEAESEAMREQRLECLDRCLGQLEPAQRDLIVEYYRGTGRQKIEARRNLAARLGISMNALSIRASRIRDALERCVEACRQE